jgi:dihydroflavonol-4-reductase
MDVIRPRTMKVLVTGGNGFIGSVVVRTLIAEGHDVRCLLRGSSNIERLDGLVYERVRGDVREAKQVDAAADRCDAIIHLASLSAWDQIDSPLMNEVVERGTLNVLSAARARPGTRVVFVSSILAVNGSDKPFEFDETARWTLRDRHLKYSRCKRTAEAMCVDAAKAGVPVVIVNPGEVYGPNDTALITACNLIDFAKSKPVLVCSGGTSVVYVDDVALAVVRAMEKGRPGERYILGGDNLSVVELATLSLELLGQRKRIVRVPNRVIKLITAVATRLRIPLPYNKHVIPYATKYWFMSNKKAKRELGVSFRSARDTLAPTLDWLKQTGRIA